MKKLIYLIGLLVLLHGQLPAYGQNGSVVSRALRAARSSAQTPPPNAKLYAREVTQILERRVQSAVQRVHQIYTPFLPDGSLDFPYISRVSGLNPLRVELLGLPAYVRSRKQVALYLAAQENRLHARRLKHFTQHVWPLFAAHEARLKYKSMHMPDIADPLAFLATALPPEVTTLAIGETHDFNSVVALVARFLPLLRQARPDQEIFLFTEFHLNAEEYEWDSESVHPYQPVFSQAIKNKIPVIGLEPYECMVGVLDHIKFEYSTGQRIEFDYALSGVKRRNKIFMQTIQTYRRLHPNALFIIYTGAEHVYYNNFLSLTTHLDPQKTFVLSVLPTRQEVQARFPKTFADQERYRWDPIGDLIQSEYHFDQPFLYWQDLAPVTGADAFIHTEKRFIHPNTSAQEAP